MISNRLNNKTKLYVHILPSIDYDWDCIKIEKDKKTLYVRHLFEFHSSLVIKPPPKFWKFRTDGIFSNCCQSEVYIVVKNDIMDHVFNGADSVVMSYGQNNSGKTFTLSGFHNQFELRGIIPRFVSDLFNEMEIKKDEFSSIIYVSVVDVYNNSIHDLLSKPIKVCNTIKGIRKVKIKSESDCFKLLFIAESCREIIANRSYNSHSGSCIVTFIIILNSLRSQHSYDTVSKVHFIDLAGVETVDRNELTSFKDHKSQGDANITKSLLEVAALRCQNPKNYYKKDITLNQRMNTLTKYLGNSFSPNSLRTFLCHIRPNHEDLMITLSLLKFGKAFKDIRSENPLIHLEENAEKTMEHLQEQIKVLQDKLIIEHLCAEHFPINISQGRITLVRHLVESFLKGDLSESDLISTVGDCSLILSMIKIISKEKSDMVDKALQTDKEKELRFSSTGNIVPEKPVHKHKRNSLVKQPSFITDNELPLKQASFQDKNTIKAIKQRKNAGKLQSEDIVMKSEEVQVNLIEPFSELPTIDSRENHWATFLVCRPEIQAVLDNLIVSIKEKEKCLNTSKLNYENVLHSINSKELQLKILESNKHVAQIEQLEKEVKTPIPEFQEEEVSLLSELKLLKRALESTKQKVINDQIEWLDALQNLNDAKQTIEIEFEHFCSLNNYLTLELSSETEDDKCQESKVIDPTNELQAFYNAFQKKYLRKI